MKQQIGALPALLAAIAFTIAACGGRETIASKSAAAYDDAKKKGIPIETGEHGGHEAEAPASEAVRAATAPGHVPMAGMDHAATAAMDHPSMPEMPNTTSASGALHQAAATHHTAMPARKPGQDVAGMDDSTMPGTQRDSAAAHAMAGMDHSAMAGMDHSTTPGTQHDSPAHGMAGMDHSAMAGMDHSKTPGMQHDSPAHGMASMPGTPHDSMPGMPHGPRPVPVVATPPRSNAAIAATQPAATLRADEFDTPAAASVDEAAKAASGVSQPMETATPAANPPEPPSAGHHHGGGEAA